MTHIKSEIALVVKTKNRGSNLEPFFASISRMECPYQWELIIVDGSTDDSNVELRALANAFRGQVKIITDQRPGFGLACNLGWQSTTAPIIAFTDDDCYPDKDYLSNIQTVFKDPHLGFVGGRILLYDLNDAPITINKLNTEKPISAGKFICAGFIQGANMAFRRETLLDIKGFDEYLDGGEDYDVVLRALAAGWNGKYDPRPMVYHHHRRKPGNDLERHIKYYDYQRGACYAKCLLYMPQRWQCARHWIRSMLQQPLAKSWREGISALEFFTHQIRHKY